MTTACKCSPTQTRVHRAAQAAQWLPHFSQTRETLLAIARQLGQR